MKMVWPAVLCTGAPHDPEGDGGRRCASPPSMFSGEKERRKARQDCMIEKFEQNLPKFGKIHQFYKKIFLYVFYLLSFVFEFNSLVFQRFCWKLFGENKLGIALFYNFGFFAFLWKLWRNLRRTENLWKLYVIRKVCENLRLRSVRLFGLAPHRPLT